MVVPHFCCVECQFSVWGLPRAPFLCGALEPRGWMLPLPLIPHHHSFTVEFRKRRREGKGKHQQLSLLGLQSHAKAEARPCLNHLVSSELTTHTDLWYKQALTRQWDLSLLCMHIIVKVGGQSPPHSWIHYSLQARRCSVADATGAMP